MSPADLGPGITGRRALTPEGLDSCPGCAATKGVRRLTVTPPGMAAWACGGEGGCGMEWLISPSAPGARPALPDRPADLAELGEVLLAIIVLAERQDFMPAARLREALTALAERAQRAAVR
ncbi:MAG: hypothetical protein ACRDQX_16680 [Pseudonocardiaceae bacterium]